ncbi:MAG TPA: multiheme c-type cytochrome [Streptosporangiaceae bacterium]|nr:multiheme c-type cytochrome [Streptosporangiaceae bacterium]
MTVERLAFALAAVCAVAGAGAAGAQQPRGAGASRAAASQCVACHGSLADTTGAGHGFAAWRKSPHAAAGVGCEACHGGDPAARDRQAAHRGVAVSTDPDSRVYFIRVPDTCGRCHASEVGYFRTSIHYARLRADGRGPNCVTCHGAMATSVLTPERLLETCSACHTAGGVAPPDKAREAAQVLALVRVENLLFDVVSADAAAQRTARGAARARVMLDDAERHLTAAAEIWHSFRLDSASARLGDARENLVAAWIALDHAAPLEARLGRTGGGR